MRRLAWSLVLAVAVAVTGIRENEMATYEFLSLFLSAEI
jgi:hypothetical protein